MPTLEEAVAIAAEAHKGQTDKGGHPYILHPMRVALSVDTEDERIVALLHDVVEDNPSVTIDRLKEEGYSDSVVAALDVLTKKSGQSYRDYVMRVRDNELAKRVKLADLKDNLDLSRIPHPEAEDYRRRDKYRWAVSALESESDHVIERSVPADEGDWAITQNLVRTPITREWDTSQIGTPDPISWRLILQGTSRSENELAAALSRRFRASLPPETYMDDWAVWLRDSEGRHWQLRPQPEPAPGALIFRNAVQERRHEPFVENSARVPPEELEEYLKKAEIVWTRPGWEDEES